VVSKSESKDDQGGSESEDDQGGSSSQSSSSSAQKGLVNFNEGFEKV
jgi:hypothetical protein